MNSPISIYHKTLGNKADKLCSYFSEPSPEVYCSGGSSGGARGARPPPPPLFWVEKEEMTEGKMADRASKSRPPPPPPPPLAQGLDPPLYCVRLHFNITKLVCSGCRQVTLSPGQ